MTAKIKYTDEPLGKVQVVPDFLPSPAELAFREEGVKVTAIRRCLCFLVGKFRLRVRHNSAVETDAPAAGALNRKLDTIARRVALGDAGMKLLQDMR